MRPWMLNVHRLHGARARTGMAEGGHGGGRRVGAYWPVVCRAALGLAPFLLLASTSARAQAFSETITFQFRSDQVPYQGGINTAWLMLDVEGGRNRVSDARPMTCEGTAPKTCSATASLTEGDYLYVFVVNPDAYVDMSDPNLNPDDIPDQNFFRDPNPRNAGFCGQYSTDNCLFVRNPKRPVFEKSSFSPGHGALVTADAVELTVRVSRGSDGKPLDPQSVRVRYEDGELPGLRYAGPAASTTQPSWVDVAGATLTSDSTGGTVSATLNNLPEGFLRVAVSVANDEGLAADDLITGVLVNRDNLAPVASAGPTWFAAPNQEVQLDATMTRDPDQIGFAEFQWRVVQAPAGGNGVFRCLEEELIPRDGYGKPFIDVHGNPVGDPCNRIDFGATPRFAGNVPGTYRVGLRVRDLGAGAGLWSEESFTEVHVVPSWNLGIRPRIEVAVDGSTVRLDGSLTENSSANGWFVEDAMNPAPVPLSVDGLVASFPKPEIPGAYFFHFTVDNAYPATAMVRVLPDGSVDGQDLARPPEAWRTEKILYLGYVREFFDADGDGEGDLLGMIDELAHLARLGVNALWLMPISEGPTTHGYATSGFFDVEADYGTEAHLELLLESARAFGIEPVMDLVANHTSDQHPFFQAARQNPDSPLRQWYAFNPDGAYRYAFTFVALPDQDQNNPLVRQGILDIVDWHFDRGFTGIRCDIAGFTPPGFWKVMRRHLKARNPDAIMLAELIPPVPEFFDDGFDLAYDSTSFHALHWAFAAGASFDDLDNALESSTGFVSRAYSERVRHSTRQEDVLFMRYIDNQDEDRFLLHAGGDFRLAKSVATVLFTLPGVPMMTYGNEVGIQELRGRMPFAALNPETGMFDAAREQLFRHYQKLIAMRKGNLGLRMQDIAPENQTGNSYIRISSGADDGGGNVYSFVRFGAGQRFIVMSSRSDSTAIGTQTAVYPPASMLEGFPEGELVLVNHLDPRVQVRLSRAQLLAPGGVRFQIPAFGSRVFQVTRFGIPDEDEDGVLDSWDNCVGVPNERQVDADADGVGDRCDLCPGTAPGVSVGTEGCTLTGDDGAARARYTLDGVVDSSAMRLDVTGDRPLYASFNGRELYVATEAAARGEDVFILVTDNVERVAAAPFGKAGDVATDGIFLADEGENDFAQWFGMTGQAVAKTHALPGRGHLEGTLNVLEEFGQIPPVLYVAAVRYGGADGDGLLTQTPAGDGDNRVSALEFQAFPLTAVEVISVDAGPEPGGGSGGGAGGPVVVQPGDGDGDGVEELVDNCPGLYNPDQGDGDQDGYGDACDACPVSPPGLRVDSDGCAERPAGAPAEELDRAEPRIVDDEDPVAFRQSEYGCSSLSGSTGHFPLGLAMLMIMWGWQRNRQARPGRLMRRDKGRR